MHITPSRITRLAKRSTKAKPVITSGQDDNILAMRSIDLKTAVPCITFHGQFDKDGPTVVYLHAAKYRPDHIEHFFEGYPNPLMIWAIADAYRRHQVMLDQAKAVCLVYAWYSGPAYEYDLEDPYEHIIF